MKYKLVLSLGLILSACGGGGDGGMTSTPGPTAADFATAMANLVGTGLSANVTLSGTVSGSSISGTGTYVLTPVVSVAPILFNGSPANALTLTASFQVTVAGQTNMVSSSVTDYYEPATFRFMGEQESNPPPGNEYDIAQPPLSFPATIHAGDSGTLGTVLRYTDSTQSTALGTTTVSYLVKANAASNSSLIFELTTKIYDTNNATAIETDVTDYAVTANGVISFVSSSAQTGGDSLTVTAH